MRGQDLCRRRRVLQRRDGGDVFPRCEPVLGNQGSESKAAPAKRIRRPLSVVPADELANVAGSAHENQPLARQAAKRALDVCGGSTRSDLALFAVGRRLAPRTGLVYPTTT